MWLYLIGCVSGLLLYRFGKMNEFKIKNMRTSISNMMYVAKKLKEILGSNGIETYILWTKQIIANEISKKIVEVHHKYYIIHYPYGVNWYKIYVPRLRQPCMFETIVDNEGNDITEDLIGYLGPSYNFHDQRRCAKDFGYKGLKFIYIDGSEKEFGEKEVLNL